ncbi:hypothetical protein H2O64_12930 [Kordia sp. YSTF-M3]|uniref:Bacteriocin n=1 Tax=Kordia aestuariivivens TaxID=2759037 RepID=A0ABR7QAI2_9FLAO|nr:hypothetical protein [Kordia aestuariivivens]MBC8755574.1 hypothetical protein [Kordia aestuariivivens]
MKKRSITLGLKKVRVADLSNIFGSGDVTNIESQCANMPCANHNTEANTCDPDKSCDGCSTSQSDSLSEGGTLISC